MTSTGRIRATAIGFALGSALFALGVPLSGAPQGPVAADWVFFAGSVFFTLAAAGQLITSAADLVPVQQAPGQPEWRARVARPRTLDWGASAIQFLGTLAFNVTTLLAALDAVGAADATSARVWRPDAVGSVLFLVSSAIACVPEIRWRRHSHVRRRSGTIAGLNMLGSLFFGISAIGAFTEPTSGSLLNAVWANAGTFLGALCFLAGALLLIPSGSADQEAGPA
jgi:hypothetical protein